MTESREVLRLTMAVAEREHRQDISTTFVQCSCGWVPDRGLSGSDAMRQFFDHVNDARLNAILAHPVAVLDLLENAPCETCGGTGYRSLYGGVDPPKNPLCSACGGSGILGRDGVLRLLGMEQVMDASGLSLGHGVGPDVVRWRGRVVFARVPVPEPSEGEK